MKEIILTQGKIALVDDEDFEELNHHKWRIKNDLKGHSYAGRTTGGRGKRKNVLMHRVITNPLPNIQVDHINHNGLDNQKHNLRLCNNSQNSMNRITKSGIKGVHWHTKNKKWHAQITMNYKRISLGFYDLKNDALVAYNNKSTELFGEFARLNPVAFLSTRQAR